MHDDILRLKAPLLAQFEITPACNNNCGFCYNFWQYDSKSELSRKSPFEEENIRHLMDILLDNEVPAICFTGGEPLLAENTLYHLIETASQNKIYTSVNTNGRLITKDVACKLKEIGLSSVLVSLHGDLRQVHEEAVGDSDAFSQTLDGIKNSVDAGLNITVNYVSTQKNIGRIVQTSSLLSDLGVKRMTVTPLLPFPGVKSHKDWAMKKEQFGLYFDSLVFAKENGLKIDSTLPVAPCILKSMFPENYEKYLEVLSPRVCMAGVTFMVVSPQGFSRACIQAPQLDKYGAYINNDFGQAWSKASDWSKLDLIPDECSDKCYALSSCGGGCRTSSLAINKSVSGKTMYMGEPLSPEESKPFIERMEVPIDRNITAFCKNKNVKLREESFGAVLSNTSHQSFVILDKVGSEAYSSMPEEFIAKTGNRGIYVLYAAGILEPSTSKDLTMYYNDISVIHASKLYPRLAAKLPLDDKIRMLRADTGERIYF